MDSIFVLICVILVLIMLLFALTMWAVFRIVFGRDDRVAKRIISSGEKKVMKDFENMLNRERRAFLDAYKEEVSIESFDGLNLHGYLVKGENHSRTIICVHGYRGSPEHDFGPAFRELLKSGDLLLVDQRAHGKSEGKFITFGVNECKDCKSWVQYILDKRGQDHPVYLNGISMGATSVLLASALNLPKNTRGIIADCGFSSPCEIISEVAKKMLKTKPDALVNCVDIYCKALGKFSIKGTCTESAMRQNSIPILFVHGQKDSLVPYHMTRTAFDACSAPKFLVLSEKADHGMSYLLDRDRYREEIQKLFLECEKNST